MKYGIPSIILAACCTLTPLAKASTPLSNLNAANSETLAPILQIAMPAVVNILASGKVQLISDPFLRKQLQQNLPAQALQEGLTFNKAGSGVIIDAKHGIIITNAHMVSQAQTIVVNLKDGRKYLARLLGLDDDTDIAVLQINADHLTALPMANSNQLKVGDFVAAIGSPFGLQQTVTSGIVSSLHRANLGIEGLEDFIQTDASINTGNSGGALINAYGRLVGMNTAILANEGGNIGIGFAIPSNMIQSVVSQIMKYGRIERGILGVVVQNLNPQLAEAFQVSEQAGAVVTEVLPYSPAAQSGIQVGDIIEKVNGQTVEDNGQVRAIIGLLRVGSPVTLSIIRDGHALTFNTAIANPAASAAQAKAHNPFLYGLTLRDIQEVANNNQYVQGIMVLNVAPDSLAWTMGLEKGDIIVGANLKPVHNIKELQTIASQAKDHLLLRVIAKDGSYFILL